MATNFSPSHCESDCREIHDSFGGVSSLVRALVAKTTVVDRRRIRETYKTMYGEDLLSHLQRLKVMLSGRGEKFSVKTCEGLALWMVDPCERDACLAKEAIEQTEVDYGALVEIFVGRKSSHILMIKQAYQTRFRSLLDQDIARLEPPHPCQRILAALSTSHKAHHADVSQDIAKTDAIRLYQTGEGSSGRVNEAVVLEILSKRSICQLKLTFACYKRIYGHSYTRQFKKVDSTQFEEAIESLVKCISHPPKYYAEMLQRSLTDGASKKRSLIRIMVSRAEVDMGDIQRKFRVKYGVELKDAICKSIPPGDYRDFLLALSNNNAFSGSQHH